MKFVHRLAYYLGGFTVGIVILMFILSGKKTSCSYGPESRTLKNIRIKERAFSENTLQLLRENQLDTSAISELLKNGDVLFSESNTKLDSCNQYVIEGKVLEKNLKIRVTNCSKVATVVNAEIDSN